MTTSDCPICSSQTVLGQAGMYDDRYGCPGLFDLYHCGKCGHIHLKARFSAEELASLYNSYYPRVTFSVDKIFPYREQKGFRAWFDGEKSFAYTWVPRDVRILDIGCGFGETLGYHKNRGCEVFGVETDENVQKVADKFGCTFHAGLFDPENYDSDYFDYITLDQVVEHFARPVDSLTAIAKILKKNGTVVICTPNPGGWGPTVFGRKWLNWHIPYHLQLFSTNSMKLLADRTGFVLERHATITSANWLYYQLCSLVKYPAPGEPNIFWSSRVTRRFKDVLLLMAVDWTRRLKVTHFVTKAFDLAGLGDNHVFILRKT